MGSSVPESSSQLKAALTVLTKHHGDSIVVFHLDIVSFHISIVIFHISGGVGWGGVHCEGPWEPEVVGDCRVFA